MTREESIQAILEAALKWEWHDRYAPECAERCLQQLRDAVEDWRRLSDEDFTQSP